MTSCSPAWPSATRIPLWSRLGFLLTWPNGVDRQPHIMVLGVGGFAQAVMQILSDDGAEVSCALTRNYAHASPAFAGPTHDLANADSLALLIEHQSVGRLRIYSTTEKFQKYFGIEVDVTALKQKLYKKKRK